MVSIMGIIKDLSRSLLQVFSSILEKKYYYYLVIVQYRHVTTGNGVVYFSTIVKKNEPIFTLKDIHNASLVKIEEEVVKDVMVINVSYLGKMAEKTMETNQNA